MGPTGGVRIILEKGNLPMNRCPIDNSPWNQLADYYFSGTSVRDHVALNWDRYESKYEPVLQMGDDIADPLASAIIDRRVKQDDFEQALTRGIDTLADPDPTLQTFFSGVDHIPACIDIDSVARGAAVLRQVPITVGITHGVVAGFLFAAMNADSSIPLSLNKSIAQATRRRYIETTKYVSDTLTEKGMERFGVGFQSACRVRLVHAFVRTEIVRHFPWNSEAYHAPIHPVALLLVSSVTGVWGTRYAERNGCHFSPDELRDIASHNAYMAYLQGVPEDLLIPDYDLFCEHIYWSICRSPLPLPDDHSRALSVLQPLLENGYPLSSNRFASWFFNQTILTSTRSLMGDKICNAFDVPRSRMAKPLAIALAGMNRLLIGARRSAMLNPIYKKVTSHYWDVTIPHLVEKITGKDRVSYAATAKGS